MILPGLTGPTRYIVFGLAALLLVAAIIGGIVKLRQLDAAEDNQLIESGVTKERSESQSEVLNSVQNANDARDNPSPELDNRVCEEFDRNC